MRWIGRFAIGLTAGLGLGMLVNIPRIRAAGHKEHEVGDPKPDSGCAWAFPSATKWDLAVKTALDQGGSAWEVARRAAQSLVPGCDLDAPPTPKEARLLLQTACKVGKADLSAVERGIMRQKAITYAGKHDALQYANEDCGFGG